MLRKFMYNPKEAHLQAIHRVLQYFQGTPRNNIQCKSNKGLVLKAYTLCWVSD